ncbi:MAG: hypothetical protein ACRDOK_16200 [Streptosporangiaceae bacterium]
MAEIPTDPFATDAYAASLLILLLRQASDVRNSVIEHDLRNLTGIRPWKP